MNTRSLNVTDKRGKELNCGHDKNSFSRVISHIARYMVKSVRCMLNLGCFQSFLFSILNA